MQLLQQAAQLFEVPQSWQHNYALAKIILPITFWNDTCSSHKQASAWYVLDLQTCALMPDPLLELAAVSGLSVWERRKLQQLRQQQLFKPLELLLFASAAHLRSLCIYPTSNSGSGVEIGEHQVLNRSKWGCLVPVWHPEP